MNKMGLLIINLIILFIILLSGCQEQKATTTGKKFENITLESDLVELVDASLEFNEDNNVKLRVDAEYLFRNIAGREIAITVTVEFYDENDNLITIRGEKHILNIPKNYTEKTVLEANNIYYDGEDAYKVNHVKIIAAEE